MTDLDFIRRLPQNGEMTMLERALALLWWAGRDDPTLGRTTRDLCGVIESAGHPAQNVPRLEARLAEDNRTSKVKGGGWKLRPNAREKLEGVYAFAREPGPPPDSDSIVPRSLVERTRGYIEKVVEQINKSYDAALYDCCAVMCRRVVETLIIEVYEAKGRAAEIKGGDGHFMMLNGLVGVIENDGAINLGRNAKEGLKELKKLGDLSAHNRRFNAQKADIERVRDNLRVSVQELVQLAQLQRAA